MRKGEKHLLPTNASCGVLTIIAPAPSWPPLCVANASKPFRNLGSEMRTGFDGVYGRECEELFVEVRVSQVRGLDIEPPRCLGGVMGGDIGR